MTGICQNWDLEMKHSQANAGTAVVELAIVLPILFTIVLGSIELCNMVAMKQVVAEAAYGGALEAMKPGTEESDVLSHINTELAARNFQSHVVYVKRGDGRNPGQSQFRKAKRGDEIVVVVTGQVNINAIGPLLFTRGKEVTGRAVTIKQ